MDRDFDWFDWAGISESDTDKLFARAAKEGIEIFETDTAKDVFDRMQLVKSYKLNKRFMAINSVLAVISCIAAVVSVIYAAK